jgi:hypothetical protein
MSYSKNIAQFFFTKMRIWFFFFLFTIPFLVIGFILFPQFWSLLQIQKKIEIIWKQVPLSLKNREEKEMFLQLYSSSNPCFISQNLENFYLLSKEMQKLSKEIIHPACHNKSKIKKRIDFLNSTKNSLQFIQDNSYMSNHIRETQIHLLHSVELDLSDLEHLLCLAENISIGNNFPLSDSPQLLIHYFSLFKKTPDLYELNLSLLQREWE